MSSDPASSLPKATLQSFLASLPPYLCAFGYGSALFPSEDDARQAAAGEEDGAVRDSGVAFASGLGRKPQPLSPPQIDVIVVVEDSRAWHRDNIAANRVHYSGPLVAGGERAIVWSAQRIGVGVHFNTDTVFQDRRIKYGVVDAVDLCRDLETWDTFFLAGRLQKPVMMTLPIDSGGSVGSPPAPLQPRIVHGLATNRNNAAAAAVLIQSARTKETTLDSLLNTITGFSYAGDIRMAVGAEARNKVAAIVCTQGAKLTEMYTQPLLAACPGERNRETNRSLTLSSSLVLDMNDDDRLGLLSQLPPAVVGRGVQEFASLAWSVQADTIAQRIKQRVSRSSVRQAVSGFLGTSPELAVRYVLRKLRK